MKYLLKRNVFVVKVRPELNLFIRFIRFIRIFVSVHGETIEWTHIARMVLSALDGIIRNIQSTQPSFKGMRYKFGLKCDLCTGKTNKPCERHNVEACSNGDCVHILDLKRLKKPLYQCNYNLVALNVSELHESTWVKATGKNVFCVYLCLLFKVPLTPFFF